MITRYPQNIIEYQKGTDSSRYKFKPKGYDNLNYIAQTPEYFIAPSFSGSYEVM